MINFTDEFEYQTKNSDVYFVQVTGKLLYEDEREYTDITSISVSDHLGNPLEEDHEDYTEICEEAHNREYEVEVHSNDFDYYGQDFPNNLKE